MEKPRKARLFGSLAERENCFAAINDVVKEGGMSELRPEEGSEEIPDEESDSDGVELEEAELSEPEVEDSEETSDEETDTDEPDAEEPVGFKPKPLSDY